MTQTKLKKQTIPTLLLLIVLCAVEGVFGSKVFAVENTPSNPMRATLIPQVQDQISANVLHLFSTGDTLASEQTTTNEHLTNVSLDDEATINQTVEAVANTGYNQANRNISIGGNAGIIQTGNAVITTQTSVEANETHGSLSTEPNATSTDSQPNSLVTTTGSGSTSNLTNTHQTTLLGAGEKNTQINQTTAASATTGHNEADRNIAIGGGAAGVIQSGMAGIQSNYLVTANNTVALIGGESETGGPGSGASILRTTTGNHSNFLTNLGDEQTTATTTQSASDITQGCGIHSPSELTQSPVCRAMTGGNQSNRGINRNGDAGVIETGNAVVNLNLTTVANPTYQSLKTSSTEGENPPPSTILNTGAANHFSQLMHTAQQTILNQSNTATVSQQVTAVTDTGHNRADRNISFGGDAGVIRTGHALITAFLEAVVNPTTLD